MSILPSFRLDRKKAIVTGAASGLGHAMAIALAQAGADVVIPDIDIEGAYEVAEEIKKLGRVSFAIKTDVTKRNEVARMLKATIEKFGAIDILVNNAGIPPMERVPTHEMKQESWDRVINVDLLGVFLCSRIVGKEMVRQRGGKIINIASISGIIVNKGQTGLSAFCAAKAAVIHFTKVLATEWAKYNINVNCISPGYIQTATLGKGIEDSTLEQKMIDLTPMGRIGKPQELGGAVVFLASDASTFITGHNLVVDGGHTVW